MSKCTVYREPCPVHHFIHGAEAEELRSGIEALIEADNINCSVPELQHLLDRIDARDSLAFRESTKRARPADRDTKP